MKWYWAILQTIAILVIFVFIHLGVRPLPTSAYSFIFTLFAIWVAADSSSFGWGVFVFILWPIGYPWYLIVRDSWHERPKLPEVAGESIIEWLDRGPHVDEMFKKAVKLDRRGDWADAVAVYEQIAETLKGQQDGEYSRNCAQTALSENSLNLTKRLVTKR